MPAPHWNLGVRIMAGRDKQDPVRANGSGCDQGAQEEAGARGGADAQDKAGVPDKAGAAVRATEAPEASPEERILQAEAKATENWDLFLRARADFENYRKTMLRDRDASIRRGKKDLFLRLLDIRDNFDRALSAQNQSVEALRSGIEIIARQMESLLKAEGVEPIESAGKPFDPALHEAIATWESPDVTRDVCTDEIQRGYLYQGEVLRAARVRVAKPEAAH